MKVRILVVTVALAAAALAVPTSAAAAAPAPMQSATSGPPVLAAAVEPTMSPPAEKVLYSPLGVRSQRCETGTLCVDVWDPTRNTYKVFILRKCATRTLHDFHNADRTPEFINHQTPQTVTRFLGRGGNVLVSSTAPSYTTKIDWGPIWYIDVC